MEELLAVSSAQVYQQLEIKFEGIGNVFELLAAEIRSSYRQLHQKMNDLWDLAHANLETSKEVLELTKDIYGLVSEKTLTYPHFLNLVPTDFGTFFGRKKEFDRLKDLLKTESKVCVKGVGGIGKTTFFRRYLQQYHLAYNHIAWVEIGANDDENISIRETALVKAFTRDEVLTGKKSLNRFFDEETSASVKMQMIGHALSNIDGHNLLVIDNAGDELRRYFDLLALPPNWRTVFSTRYDFNELSNIDIDALEEAEAIDLFKRWCPGAEKNRKLTDLLKEVNHHTLMIELIAKTIKESLGSLKIDDVLDHIRNRTIDDPDIQEIITTGHNHYAETTLISHLMQTFDLSALDEEEKDIMSAFYFLPPDNYHIEELRSRLRSTLHKYDEKLSFEALLVMGVIEKLMQQQSIRLKKKLKSLAHKGWLIRHGQTFQMHRLIQQVVYYKLRPSKEIGKEILKTTSSSQDSDAQWAQRFSSYGQAQLRMYVIRKLSNAGDRSYNQELFSALQTIGDTYVEGGRDAEASVIFTEALQLRKDDFQGHNRYEETRVCIKLSEALLRQKKFGEAIKLLEEQLAAHNQALEMANNNKSINENSKNYVDFELSNLFNALGYAHRQSGDFNQSELYYLKDKCIWTRGSKKDQIDKSRIARLLLDMAAMYSDFDKPKSAEQCYREAIEYYKNNPPKEKWRLNQYPRALMDLAGFYQSKKRIPEAIATLESSLMAYKDNLEVFKELFAESVESNWLMIDCYTKIAGISAAFCYYEQERAFLLEAMSAIKIMKINLKVKKKAFDEYQIFRIRIARNWYNDKGEAAALAYLSESFSLQEQLSDEEKTRTAAEIMSLIKKDTWGYSSRS